jgi:hypothetical protein
MKKYLPYVWSPLCFIFAAYSYISQPEMCGPNCKLVNQMWFMWTIMGFMALDAYVSKCFKCDK